MRRMESAIAEHRPEIRASLRQQRRHATARQLVSGLALLLIGYVLSIGPIAWLIQDGRLPGPAEDFARVAYRPLEWLARNAEWFGEILKRYRRVWTG